MRMVDPGGVQCNALRALTVDFIILYYPHITLEETDVQRRDSTGPKSHTK